MLLIPAANHESSAVDRGAKITFVVKWFDMGQAALERLPGVVRIDKGFFKSSEINTVYYDPAKIAVTEMEDALKKAGTYLNTMNNPWLRGNHWEESG